MDGRFAFLWVALLWVTCPAIPSASAQGVVGTTIVDPLPLTPLAGNSSTQNLSLPAIYTVPETGQNNVLVVVYTARGAWADSTAESATFGGVPMTRVGNETLNESETRATTAVFHLTQSAFASGFTTSPQDLLITRAAQDDGYLVGIFTLRGVNQTSPVGVVAQTYSRENSDVLTLNATTLTPGSQIVSVMGCNYQGNIVSSTNIDHALFSNATGGNQKGSSGLTTVETSTDSLAYAYTNSARATLSAVEFLPAVPPTTYSLSYSAGANGSIEGPAAQQVLSGIDGHAVTAVPALTYQFVQWSDGRTDNPRIDTAVAANVSVTATFEQQAGPPVILLQPSSRTVAEGADVSLVVQASGSAPLTYQWTKNGNPVGTNANTLSLTNVTKADQGNYQVVVSNALDSDTSQITTLTVTSISDSYPIRDQARVLFIGNSLFGTTGGGVPVFTNEALKQMGYTGIQHGMVGNWGRSLDWGLNNLSLYNTILPYGSLQGSQYDPSAQFSTIIDAVLGGLDGDPATTDDNWEYVILQDYGEDDDTDNAIDPIEPDGVRGESFDAVVQLHAAAQSIGAQTILYMRWADNPEVNGQSQFENTLGNLQSNYDTIAAHLGGVPVVPIALIAQDLSYTHPPDTSVLSAEFNRFNFIYGGDIIHASDYGRGLFGYAVAAMLARQSPVGKPYENAGYTAVPGAIDNAIQESVWRVISSRETWADPNEATLSIITDKTEVRVPEGATGSLHVSLNADPGAATVTVSVQVTSGDPDISRQSAATLVFDNSNWNITQEVVLSAAEDADDLNGLATVTLTATGLLSKTVTAQEWENDLPPGVGVIWAEVGGVVRVEAETYYTRSATAASPSGKSWETQTDGVTESSDFSGVLAGSYLAALPDTGTNNSTRPTDGSPLIDQEATVDYAVHITTPGTYRLYPRAAGPNANGNSLYASIVELRDGDGGVNGGNPEASGDIVADWYRFITPATGAFDWISLAEYESDDELGTANVPSWTINQPGDYTLRFSFREDGVALDAFVLQLESQPPPTGDGPATSAEYDPSATPLQAWTDSINWQGTDSSPTAIVSPLGVTNLMLYALDIDNPFTADTSKLPILGTDAVTAGGPWVTFTYRENMDASDLTYTVRSSTDLVTWSDLTIDGTTVVEDVANPDPDGDGSAALIQVRVKHDPDTTPKQFLRLQVTQ